jgi:hypothetical protein
VAIVLAGLAGGLVMGFGVVFLTVPSAPAVTETRGACRVNGNTNGYREATPFKAALKQLSNRCHRR